MLLIPWWNITMGNKIQVKYIDLSLQYQSLKDVLIPTIDKVFQSGQFIFGSYLEEFENEFAAYCDCLYSVGVANGTDALFLALKSIGIGPGNEVITVPNSFIATAAAIAHTGATPVFVDVGDDYNMDPSLLEDAITSRTKAILPVHLTGKPAEMDQILQIAHHHDLAVIEDSAQAVGATYKGKKTGSFGIAGCFSLHPLKNLNAGGDGGVITTNSKEIYEKIRILRNHGLRNRDECEAWGFNSRLDALQAAIVQAKLKYLDEWTQRIREIALRYQDGLQDIIQVPHEKNYERSSYHLFMIQCKKRDALQKHLSQQGIETKIHYPIPIHLQKPGRELGYKPGDLPKSEKQATTILSLPIYPELTDTQIEYVVKTIRTFYE